VEERGLLAGTGRIGAPGPARLGLLVALAASAALAVVDIATGASLLLTTAFVIAPVGLASLGRPRQVALVGALAVALSVGSGFWDHYAGSGDHLIRIAIVGVGSALALLAAQAVERAAADRARMAVLAAVGRLSGAERVRDAIAGLEQAIIPAVADRWWLDVDGARAGEGGAPGPALDSATVTLRSGGAEIGVLGLETTAASGRRFAHDDRAFFEILAGRVTLVVANARLVTDLRSTRARLDGILGGLAEAVTVNDAHGRTVYANDAAARLLGRAGPADVIDAEPGELSARFAIAKEDGTPLTSTDMPGHRLVQGEAAPELLTRSVDRVTGHAYWLLTKATPLSDDTGSYAINIIEDVTEAKEAELRQRFLAQAGQVLASSLDYRQTLRRVAELAVPWLADWCAIDMPEPGGGIRQVALAHSDPSKVAMAEDLRRRFPPHPEADTGVPGILKGGPAELFAEIPDELLAHAIQDPEELAALRAIGMRSVMLAPMRLGDVTLGVMTFVNADSGRTFEEDDFAFAQDLALRAATAVQNARLYEEQARVAHTLQASLLPDRLVEVPGWLGAASYQAGEQGAEVGGDFYDIVPAAGGHLVFLGDVTGKGIAAAALTSLVRHSVRTAARFDPRPGAVLALVNDLLVEQARPAPVTLICALIQGARVTMAAAGHPPPLLRRGGRAEEIGARGVLLGAVAAQSYAEHAVTAQPGDTLLLYTDGVTDTPGARERFGHERLTALLDAAPQDPAEILERIEGALREFQAGTTVDDRAMLVLRFTGLTEELSAAA
jgi:PAS domain S-box-containing protein